MRKLIYHIRGSSLPMVLTVLVIVIIFSVTALTVGSAGIRQAESQEQRIQAYYLARSGAHAVAAHIVKKAETSTQAQMDAFISSLVSAGTSSNFKLDSTDRGVINVTVTKPSETQLVISSTATVDGISKTVAVDILVEKGGGGTVLTKAAYSVGTITLNDGGKVNGDIFGTSSISFSGGAKVDGEVYILPGATVSVPKGQDTSHFYEGTPKDKDAYPDFPAVSFPVFPAIPVISNSLNNLTVDANNGEINQNIRYTAGIFVKNKTLTIRKPTDRVIRAYRFVVEGGGTVKDDEGTGGLLLYIDEDFSILSNNNITLTLGDADINIVMKEMNIGGTLTVKRAAGKKGKLNLYISEEFNFNYGALRFEGDADEQQAINLYYAGTKKLTLASNAVVPGLLHVKQAELELSGGSSTSGTIISGGSKVTISGGTNIVTDMIYAPNAAVTISGGGNVTGCVISNSLTISGGASITYKPLDTEFDEWTGDSGSDEKTYKFGNWY